VARALTQSGSSAEPEQPCNKRDLPNDIALGQPPHLSPVIDRRSILPPYRTQPARFAAHRFRIISERRFRPAAVMPPLRGAFLGAAFFPAAFFFAQYWRIASICLCRPDVTSAGFVAVLFFGRPGPFAGTAGWPSRPLSAAIAVSMATFCRSSWRIML
jgi:hypothetical protein